MAHSDAKRPPGGHSERTAPPCMRLYRIRGRCLMLRADLFLALKRLHSLGVIQYRLANRERLGRHLQKLVVRQIPRHRSRLMTLGVVRRASVVGAGGAGVGQLFFLQTLTDMSSVARAGAHHHAGIDRACRRR